MSTSMWVKMRGNHATFLRISGKSGLKSDTVHVNWRSASIILDPPTIAYRPIGFLATTIPAAYSRPEVVSVEKLLFPIDGQCVQRSELQSTARSNTSSTRRETVYRYARPICDLLPRNPPMLFFPAKMPLSAKS